MSYQSRRLHLGWAPGTYEYWHGDPYDSTQEDTWGKEEEMRQHLRSEHNWSDRETGGPYEDTDFDALHAKVHPECGFRNAQRPQTDAKRLFHDKRP